MKRLSSYKRAFKVGKVFVGLGFKNSLEPCEKCGRRGFVLRRESTREFWCSKCKWGSLYEGTKQREEFEGFFAPGVIRHGEWQER